MDYLCSHCDIQLSKFEMQLNEQFPIGRLLCEFCSDKKERQIIKELADSEADMTNDYVRQSTHQEFTEDLIGDNNETS